MNGNKLQELQEVNEMIDATHVDLAQREQELEQSYVPAGITAAFLVAAIVMVFKSPNSFLIGTAVLAFILSSIMAYTVYRRSFVVRVIKASLNDIQWVKKSILDS